MVSYQTLRGKPSPPYWEKNRQALEYVTVKILSLKDDVTGFLKNDLSLATFLRFIEDCGTCSGLKTTYDIMLSRNRAYISQEDNATLGNINIKKKICKNLESTLHLWLSGQKLNVDELISALKWRWRDLANMGRIQNVKTFVIPIFLYWVSLLS